jgi:hypothetical protein
MNALWVFPPYSLFHLLTLSLFLSLFSLSLILCMREFSQKKNIFWLWDGKMKNTFNFFLLLLCVAGKMCSFQPQDKFWDKQRVNWWSLKIVEKQTWNVLDMLITFFFSSWLKFVWIFTCLLNKARRLRIYYYENI